MIELIKRLSDSFGPSGLEDKVAEIICDEMKKYCDSVELTPSGSVIATVKGANSTAPLLLSCGMDETTFMINDIDGDGFIKLKSITNHDPRGLCGKYVSVGNDDGTVITGVMSSKVLHLASGDERGKPSLDKMFVDIGKNTGDLAKEIISKGDFVTYAPSFSKFGKDKICGKALDSRACCALLIEIAKEIKLGNITPAQDLIFSFNVKEKAGKSSAFAAVYKYKPENMIIISCHSVSEFSDNNKECKLGGGPVLPTHDYAALYFGSPLYKKVVTACQKENIALQIPPAMSITSSAANSERVGSGVSVINLSLPCLNIRTSDEIISEKDILDLKKLLEMCIFGEI